MNRPTCLAPLCLTLVALSGCAIAGDYAIKDGATRARGFSAVAGDIHVGNDASIHGASTVAGDIRVEARGSTHSLKTVAGAIAIGEAALVNGNVETVAGDIQVRDGARVTGHVTTIAGEITLDACTIDGLVRLRHGRLSTNGTNLPGGIRVQNSKSTSDSDGPTRIEIGPHSTVASIDVQSDTPVILRVSREATVGPITGIEPEYF